MFTHCYIAEQVLKKLKKKKLISSAGKIDDYYFGAIAPDIRYMRPGLKREITHDPFGKDRVLEDKKFNNYSKAFLAGYETHLIVDDVWSNDKKWLGESIYEFYNVDVNNFAQKFALYGLVDDYFQAEAHSFSPLQYLLNLSQSNQHNLLFDLDFNPLEVTSYRVGSLLYLREPGIDTINIFSFITFNLEEKAVRSILNQKPNLTSFLRKFKKESIKRCVDSLEEKL
jgi:hypothetical protein